MKINNLNSAMTDVLTRISTRRLIKPAVLSGLFLAMTPIPLSTVKTSSRAEGKSSATVAGSPGYSSTTIKTTQQSPVARNCSLDGSCALQDMRFIESKKLFRFDGEDIKLASHFTDTRFVMHTKTIADLESFGVVQFIHGCMYHSHLVGGVVQKDLSIWRDEFGQQVPFQHKTWEIDNDNNDPLISAEPKHGRFALLRWNKNPADLNSETSTYYANAKPPHSTVFLSDLPSPGAVMPNLTGADNSTLEFRTCIFKIADLPTQTDPLGSNVDKSKALWCATWTHSYVWNYKTEQMDEPTAIDPICDAK